MSWLGGKGGRSATSAYLLWNQNTFYPCWFQWTSDVLEAIQSWTSLLCWIRRWEHGLCRSLGLGGGRGEKKFQILEPSELQEHGWNWWPVIRALPAGSGCFSPLLFQVKYLHTFLVTLSSWHKWRCRTFPGHHKSAKALFYHGTACSTQLLKGCCPVASQLEERLSFSLCEKLFLKYRLDDGCLFFILISN